MMFWRKNRESGFLVLTLKRINAQGLRRFMREILMAPLITAFPRPIGAVG